MKNIAFKVNILFLVLTVGFGLGSALFVQRLWEINEVDWFTGFKVVTIFLLHYVGFYILIGRIPLKIKKLKPTKLNNTGLLLLTIFWITSLLLFFRQGLLTTYLTDRTSLPFSNLFLLILIVYPITLRRMKLITLSYLSLILSLFVLSFLHVRINIFIVAFTYSLACLYNNKRDIRTKRFILLLLFTAILMMYVTFSRFADSSVVSLYTLIVKIFASFGSEFRDGLFFHARFTSTDLEYVKNQFHINFFTFYPGWSYLLPIDVNLLREAQLNTILAKELGLFDEGISGIRVGLVWEMYILFGSVGIIILSACLAIMSRACNVLIENQNYELSGITCAAMVYVYVGYPLFLVSNFGQLITFFLILYGLFEWFGFVKRD
jgi:hypothetical protein